MNNRTALRCGYSPRTFSGRDCTRAKSEPLGDFVFVCCVCIDVAVKGAGLLCS